MIKVLFLAVVVIIVFGSVHWRTILGYGIRYLGWRLTSTATVVFGQVRNANADIH